MYHTFTGIVIENQDAKTFCACVMPNADARKLLNLGPVKSKVVATWCQFSSKEEAERAIRKHSTVKRLIKLYKRCTQRAHTL